MNYIVVALRNQNRRVCERVNGEGELKVAKIWGRSDYPSTFQEYPQDTPRYPRASLISHVIQNYRCYAELTAISQTGATQLSLLK